ncbi:MAG: FtsX-like permease family protein [Candidatus Heimdallarchaeota archaeon]|nr:MAG: FtsX-like permease family protein [Candidatus Heimdallarchaeota archaeon]
MNLAFSLARKNIIRSKYRSILIVFGILLTIALETGIVITIDTLYDDFILDNRNNNYTDITVIPITKWTNITNLRKIAKDVESVHGITQASPVYSLQNKGILQVAFSDSKILIYGIDSNSHPDFSSLNVTDGKRLVKGNTIIVSKNILRMTGLKVGESVVTEYSPTTGFEVNFTIGGVISDFSFFGNNIGFSFILVDIESLYEIIPQEQKELFLSPKIDVQVQNLLDIKKVSDKLKDHMGTDYHIWVEKGISQLKITGIKSYQAAMNVVILASFVVEFLFITNILAISINDRSKEIGILRAVGSDSKQLIEIIAIEVLIYSVIGSFLGIIGGVGFAYTLLGIMQNFYPSLVIEKLTLHPTSLLATFISGIIVAIISGLYPIFIAISMPIIQNIHSRMRRGQSKYSQYFPVYWKYTIGMGSLLALTGFILQFFIGPSQFLAFEVISIHFFVIILVFLGTLFVEIGLVFFLPRIAFRLLVWFGLVTRTISMRNIAREFQKSLFTIMTSTLSLTFIVLVGLVSAAIVAGVPDFFESQWGGIDLIAEGQEGYLPVMAFSNELSTIDGIAESCLIQEQRTQIDNNINCYIFGVNYSKYEPFAEEVIDSLIFGVPAHNWLNQSAYGTHRTHGTYTVVSHLLQQKLLVSLGSNISVRIASNLTVNVTIAAVIKSNAFLENGEYLYLPTNRFQEFFNSTVAKWLLCEVNGEIEKVVDQLWEYPYFKEIIKVEYFTQMMERSLIFQSVLFQVLFIESFILAAITQFICILVSTLRMEREVGILRGLGLHKKGVLAIFLAESTALGITAAFLGLIDGLLGSLLMGWYISLSIPIKIELSLNYTILWILFSILISQVSAFIPSYRSSRRNIVAAISGRPMIKEYRESIKIRIFMKENSSQLLVSILFLLGIVTCIFLFNNSLKIMGLLPLDLIVSIFVFILDLEFITELDLFIAIAGLASIGPLSYLIVHESFPDNFARELIKSLIYGLVGIFIATCCFLLMLSINFSIIEFLSLDMIMMEISEKLDWLEGNILINLIRGAIIISFLAILFLELIIFHRIWSFLIIRGFMPQKPARDLISWIMKKSSKGQFRILMLFLCHLGVQVCLIAINRVVTEVSNDPYILYKHPLLTLLHPIMFLITALIEICFFLLLIILPIITYKNQNFETYSAVKRNTINGSFRTLSS